LGLGGINMRMFCLKMDLLFIFEFEIIKIKKKWFVFNYRQVYGKIVNLFANKKKRFKLRNE